ncbi:MAG: Ca2+-transporting ATPase [Parcubacteria group bacterium Gr01-1014_38]|nr:MAG: Ca2+-transporting ATPase [Parcubacteria group bacterium Gr01-1014_38]
MTELRAVTTLDDRSMLPHRISAHDVATLFRTDLVSGLAEGEAQRRVGEYGKNIFDRREHVLLRSLVHRLTGGLTLILLAAIGISLAIGEVADAAIIGIVVFFDIAVGLLYESYARYRIELLQKQVPRLAEVVRDGQRQLLPAEQLIPGDLVVLRAGERVPADIRLSKVQGVRVDEAVLTGEAGDVAKFVHPIETPVGLADQRNMVFAGTTVTSGHAQGLVVATGVRSVLGSLARRVVEAGWQATPLEHQLKRIGQFLGMGILTAAAAIFSLGVYRGEHPADMFRAALTLAVAAIPEDLTFILTIALAFGATRLLRHRAVVRHLTAAETLGDATVVVTDKTGTLTTGALSLLRVEGVAESWGPTTFGSAAEHSLLRRALIGAVLGEGADSGDSPRGSALERALREGVRAAHLDLPAIRRLFALFSTLAFDSKYRYRASLYSDTDSPDPILFVVGAPEVLLPKCSGFSTGAEYRPLSEQARGALLGRVADAASRGTRVLAVCSRHLARATRTATHHDIAHLTFLALLHFEDPVRPEAADAVRGLRAAGVRVLLLTGDHRGTAEAVGRATGVLRSEGTVLEGVNLDTLSDRLLADHLVSADIVARVDPLQKERIITVLQQRGEIVGMLGDGINDAIALRRADLGIAVTNATDVAKDASDLVLLGGGLSPLAAAVREGRRIRETVRTVLLFLFSTNLTEILAVGVTLFLGFPLPFLPAQLLWVNVVSDGTADVALALEPPGTRPGGPTPGRRRGLFQKRDLASMLLTALAIVPPVLVTYFWVLEHTGDLTRARTMAFAVLVSTQVLTAFSYRSLETSMFRLSPVGNPWLLLSTVLSFALLGAGIHWVPLSTLLGTVPLSAFEWGLALGVSFLGVLGVEARKVLIRLFGLEEQPFPAWTPLRAAAPNSSPRP